MSITSAFILSLLEEIHRENPRLTALYLLSALTGRRTHDFDREGVRPIFCARNACKASRLEQTSGENHRSSGGSTAVPASSAEWSPGRCGLAHSEPKRSSSIEIVLANRIHE